MITVHSGWETDFSGLGICPLQPTECTVEEQAGGLYQLKMTHPMDDQGRWLNLTAWNIIRAPAPVRETPYINMMVHTETTVTRSIYTVRVNTRLRLRTKPSTSTGVIIGRYKNGTEVIKTGQSGDWYQVIVCSGGQMGWMHSGYLTFARNETETVPGEDVPGKVVEPRQTRDQLFRIMSVSRDDEAKMVYVTALHVFYDLTGVTVGSEYSPEKVAASVAAQAIFEKAIKPHGFEIYSNNDEKISGEYTGRSIVSALLEEDGVVQQSKARLVRDNFDVFVLKDDVRDRGVEIRHGKNLQGAELTIDVSDVVTSVIPVGRDKNGDPIRLSGQIYVDADNAAELPVVRAKEIEYDVRTGSDGFETDDKVRAELERLAREEYTENGINLPTVGLNVSFIMLENTHQYAAIKNYASLQSVYLYDIVRVISAKAGIDALIRVTGYVYNCITRRYDDVTLGELFELSSSISGYDISAGSLSGKKLIAGSVSGEKVQNATINYAKITQAAIEQLAADAITAVSAHINQLVAGTIEADQLYADLAAIAMAEITTANIEKANIDWAQITTLSAQVAEIAKAQIESADIDWANIHTLSAVIADIAQARINSATITSAQITDLNAAVAKIAQANIAAADIGFAQIKDLTAGTAIITEGVGGRLYIGRLAVTEANMVSLSVGELIIKGDDGGFYALGVDADGNITTTLKQVGNGDIKDLSINAGEKIIEGTITAATLNVNDIFADSAIIRQLIAANLEVDTLWNREAWMSKINGLGGSLDLSANESIRLIVGQAAEGKSRVFRQEDAPEGAKDGDLWIQPGLGRTWQYCAGAAAAPVFALGEDGQLAYGYADGETVWPLRINEDGWLEMDADAPLQFDPDHTGSVWLLVVDTDKIDSRLTSAESAIVQTADQIALTVKRVDTVQSAVMTAQSTAESAQSSADNAQSTANSAQSAASSAQSTAEAAQSVASANASNISALTTRVTASETAISQNASAISLRATKAELSALETRVETAEIAVEPDSIAAVVRTKVAFGGTNLVLNSAFRGLTGAGVVSFDGDEAVFSASATGVTSGVELYIQLSADIAQARGREITLSMDYRVDSAISYGASQPWVGAQIRLVRADGDQYIDWYGGTIFPTAVTGKWVRYARTYSISDAEITAGWLILRFRDASGTVRFRHPKLEIGGVATEWSPSPEDPGQALNTYSGVRIDQDEIQLVSAKTTIAVPGGNGEDDVARFDAEGVHARIVEADTIYSPSVVATQGAETFAPANAGALAAIGENLRNVCLTGDVTVNMPALTGGTLNLTGVSGGHTLKFCGGTLNGANILGCSARIEFENVTFATSGAAVTANDSDMVLLNRCTLNAGTGVLADEGSRVRLYSCGGVCDVAANSRGFSEVTFNGTVPGTDMPYGVAQTALGGQIYAGARLTAKPSSTPEPDKPTVQTVTLTPTLTRTYDGSWRDGYWLWQGRYGTRGLNRGCMWFDTSAFAGRTVLSASLSLKRLSGAGSGGAVAVKICGTTATGASGAPAVGSQYASVSIGQNERRSVDVTAAAQALASGSIRGLMLYDSSTTNMSSSNNYTACYAKLYGYDSGDRPVLTVTYQ